jgi:purine nucleosidase
MRLLVDCDTGIDDALMLLYLAGSPEAEIVAVGSVHGNISAQQAANNTRVVLEVVGLNDVPVTVGAALPLAQPLLTSEYVHGDDGLGSTGWRTPRIPPVEGESAAAQIVRLARAEPGSFTLLASAPLTNLALALLLEPDLPALIPRVVIMGGAIACPGNITPLAEANIWHDPEAADLVLGAGWDLTLVGLDVTMQTILTGQYLDRLHAAQGAVPRFAWEIIQFYLGFYQTSIGYWGCAMHDPLAAAIALDPSFARYQRGPVSVELRGSETRGMTVMDRRGYRDTVPIPRSPVSVAMEVDAERFLDQFLTRLGA